MGAGRSGGDASGVGTIVHEGLRLSTATIAAIAALAEYTRLLQLHSTEMVVTTRQSSAQSSAQLSAQSSPRSTKEAGSSRNETGARTYLRTPRKSQRTEVRPAPASTPHSCVIPARCQQSTITSCTLVLLEIAQMIHPLTNSTPTPSHVQPQLCPSIYLAAREQLFAWFLRLLLAYCIAWLLNRSPTRYFVDPFIFHAWRALFTYLAFTRWFSLFSFEMRSCVVMMGIGDPGMTIVTAVVGALMVFWEVILGKC